MLYFMDKALTPLIGDKAAQNAYIGENNVYSVGLDEGTFSFVQPVYGRWRTNINGTSSYGNDDISKIFNAGKYNDYVYTTSYAVLLNYPSNTDDAVKVLNDGYYISVKYSKPRTISNIRICMARSTSQAFQYTWRVYYKGVLKGSAVSTSSKTASGFYWYAQTVTGDISSSKQKIDEIRIATGCRSGYASNIYAVDIIYADVEEKKYSGSFVSTGNWRDDGIQNIDYVLRDTSSFSHPPVNWEVMSQSRINRYDNISSPVSAFWGTYSLADSIRPSSKIFITFEQDINISNIKFAAGGRLATDESFVIDAKDVNGNVVSTVSKAADDVYGKSSYFNKNTFNINKTCRRVEIKCPSGISSSDYAQIYLLGISGTFI